MRRTESNANGSGSATENAQATDDATSTVHTVRLPSSTGSIDIEYAWINSDDAGKPVIVFLHEGLGSLAIWNGWPRRLCSATGCRGLIFSRYGYGYSTPRRESEWPADYMEREAAELLPALFQALGIGKPILFGHSDGGTIALQYAARYPDALSGLIVVAAHISAEEIAISRIGNLRKEFGNGKLAARLDKLHRDGRAVFEGWSGVWTSGTMRDWNIAAELESIACPTLVVQGRQDQYGTLQQVTGIVERVPTARAAVLEDCRHVPHEEKPEEMLALASAFVREALEMNRST